MSKKRKVPTPKPKNPSKIGEFYKTIPTWLKFVGLLVPIFGVIISFLSYKLDKQNYSDELTVLVSTESALNFEGGKMHASPPVSVSIVSKEQMICGRDLIISNTGGVSTALVGFQGQFSHESLAQPIFFETIGNEVYLADTSSAFSNGLESLHVTILNENPWVMSPETFRETDILAFPVEVEAHSSFKVRVALRLVYKTEDEANAAFSRFDYGTNLEEREKVPKVSLQFRTSTAKITKPIEFKCFDGIFFFPVSTAVPTPTSSSP